MKLSTIYQLYHREYSNTQRVFKIILSFIILIIGGLIYVGCREKSLLMFDWFQQLGINNEIDTFRGFVNSDSTEFTRSLFSKESRYCMPIQDSSFGGVIPVAIRTIIYK